MKKIDTKKMQEQAQKPLAADKKTVKKTTNKPASKSVPRGTPAKRGRPKVTEGVLMSVIERMCEGESLNQICKDPKMPSRGTVLNYALLHRDAKEEWVQRFAQAYSIAKQVRAEGWADELLEIADNVEASSENVQKARLQADTRKWLLSKLLIEFGDKSRHELSGPNGSPIKSENSVVFYLPSNNRQDTDSIEEGEENE